MEDSRKKVRKLSSIADNPSDDEDDTLKGLITLR